MAEQQQMEVKPRSIASAHGWYAMYQVKETKKAKVVPLACWALCSMKILGAIQIGAEQKEQPITMGMVSQGAQADLVFAPSISNDYLFAGYIVEDHLDAMSVEELDEMIEERRKQGG